MKMKKRTAAIAALCTLTLLFGGCAADADAQSAENEKEQAYEQTISALQATLQEQESLYTEREAAYKAEIETLKAQIAALSAVSDGTSPDGTESVEFRYRESEGGVTITGYSGNVALLHIPATLNGLPVVAIGERAFEGASLTAVLLPEGVTTVGWFAFYNCHNLINVTLPASVSSIGYAVFDGCGDLTLVCGKDTYAERYARSYGFSYINN